MCLDIAGTHASGIEGQDLVVKAVKAGLSLLNDDGFKLTVAVARDADLSLSKLSFDSLLAVPSAAITNGFALACRLRLLLFQMVFISAFKQRFTKTAVSCLSIPPSPSRSSEVS